MQSGLRLDVRRDWNWSDGYLPEVRRILLQNAVYLFNVDVASYALDVKQATDMLLTVSGRKNVAVRLRRASYHQRDLTIRAARASGVKTELDKLRSGYGDIYLYGWTLEMQIQEWMLVDLHQVRKCGLLNTRWPFIGNTDKATQFIAIPYTTLKDSGCILAATVR
jgi:MoaA/NifB/PqqE/SkfB family radical SAM enzyme